jgi:hypothetical protein
MRRFIQRLREALGSAAGAVRCGRAARSARAVRTIATSDHSQFLSGVAVAREVEARKDAKCFREARVSEFVPHSAAFRDRGDKAALAEAGQMVGKVGSGGAEAIGELGRIAGSVEEIDEHPPTGRVGERGPDPTEDL